MTRRFNRFADTFLAMVTAFDGARQAAAEVERGRKPSATAMRKMGLDPKSFDSVQL
jgi:hypothetical protein